MALSRPGARRCVKDRRWFGQARHDRPAAGYEAVTVAATGAAWQRSERTVGEDPLDVRPRFVCAGLAERGHQVSILGWQARGEVTDWQGCAVYPVRHDGFGADVLLPYLRRIQPDILVTLADVWWLTFIADPAIAPSRGRSTTRSTATWATGGCRRAGRAFSRRSTSRSP
jgi:hypothetical protein